MNINYTKKEVEAILVEKFSAIAPKGKQAVIKLSDYATEYCTVTFEDEVEPEPVTAETATKSEVVIETVADGPIDLSDIPF